MERMSPGEFVCGYLAALERDIGPYAYLRNHENLPHDVGNDVDILIACGDRAAALETLLKYSRNAGWRYLREVKFGPLSVFLVSEDEVEFLHIDFFERLDWHWLPYAHPGDFLKRRNWNGRVHHLESGDEVFLNVMTRLIYNGSIREKHRKQADAFLKSSPPGSLAAVFGKNLRCGTGTEVCRLVESGAWDELERRSGKLRGLVVGQCLFRRPTDSLKGLFHYLKRGISRSVRPPGILVVFEGADGVGKSTVIEGIIPALEGLSGRKDTLLFHWKPCHASIRNSEDTAGTPMNPRARAARSKLLSMIFLLYHWSGFWWGWIRHIRPALVKNRAVVGDRYAYEFFLDPARLRLNLPSFILRLASKSVPQPDLVIGLVADPNAIAERKRELSIAEIDDYQQRIHHLQQELNFMVTINADRPVGKVVSEVRTQLIRAFSKDKTRNSRLS